MRIIYLCFVLFWWCMFTSVVQAQAQTESGSVNVLMVDAFVYDQHYSDQISGAFSRLGTDVVVNSLADESLSSLETALINQDLVIVTYANKGDMCHLARYGKALAAYAAQGGVVVFTGAHDISKLNFFQLLNFEKVTYSPAPQIETLKQNLFTKLFPNRFTTHNYTYPATIANPDYVSLAQDQGNTVYGYAKRGKGLIFYVGLEFYAIDEVNRLVLNNLVDFVRNQKSGKLTGNTVAKSAPVLIRSIEAQNNQLVEWNVFPNPYVTRTQAEFIVNTPSKVEANIFSTSGVLLARPILSTIFEAGKHNLDIPDLPYGTFMIHLRIGDQVSIKKIVRLQAP
jgi:hypothetical protein